MENNNHQDTTFNGTEARQDKSVDAYFMSFPPGYGFYPSDEELIENYLKKKVMKRELPINRIFDVNLYNEHPESLTGKYKLVSANEWYFFTQRARKYPKANRPNRKAGEGYWKSIGSDVAIPQRNPQGYRASLHYYTGKHPNGRKTEWKMHEFRLRDSPSTCSNSGGSSRDSKMRFSTGGQVGCAGMKMGNHVALDGLPSSSNPLMHFPAPEEDSWLPGLVDNSPFPENELPDELADELVDHYIKYDVWDDNEDEQKLKAGD